MNNNSYVVPAEGCRDGEERRDGEEGLKRGADAAPDDAPRSCHTSDAQAAPHLMIDRSLLSRGLGPGSSKTNRKNDFLYIDHVCG